MVPAGFSTDRALDMGNAGSRPNIVLICVDQWRGDCLSIDGHSVVYTPYLNELALNGVRFARAYSAVPSCIAARAGLLTGQSQRTHGRVGYRDGVEWNYPVTIASEFARHGYHTQAVGKMHVYPERSLMGFHNVILHDGYVHYARNRHPNLDLIDDYLPWLRQQLGRDADYAEHGVECNSQVARPWDKPEYTHPSNWVVTQSIEFLKRRDPRKPFFLFMSFHRPHPPYDPPAWALEQYLQQEMPPPPVGDWHEMCQEQHTPHRPNLRCGKMDPRLLHRARAGYYGLMTHIDHQVKRFIEVLTEYQLIDNTFICFISDHGEMLGDHHLFRKSLPYEGSARIPFILQGPPDSGVRRGAKVTNAVVELRDVMPTLLDCAGLEIPETAEGRSVLPLARGQQAEWRQHLHGEHASAHLANHWIISGQWKYVWFSQSGREQLFDLASDPQERHDLLADGTGADRAASLRQILIRELTGREEGFTDGKKLIPVQKITPVLSHVLQ